MDSGPRRGRTVPGALTLGPVKKARCLPSPSLFPAHPQLVVLFVLSTQDHVLLLPGDISDDIDMVRETLAVLRRGFREVCFTPGNHDLWVRRGIGIERCNSQILWIGFMWWLCGPTGACEQRGVNGTSPRLPIAGVRAPMPIAATAAARTLWRSCGW